MGYTVALSPDRWPPCDLSLLYLHVPVGPQVPHIGEICSRACGQEYLWVLTQVDNLTIVVPNRYPSYLHTVVLSSDRWLGPPQLQVPMRYTVALICGGTPTQRYHPSLQSIEVRTVWNSCQPLTPIALGVPLGTTLPAPTSSWWSFFVQRVQLQDGRSRASALR